MNKVYSRINWKNYPNTETAVNATNLNRIDLGLDTVDNRVIELDTGKANQTDFLNSTHDVVLNMATGVLTVTKENGSSITYNTNLHQIAINWDYDPVTQRLILLKQDGTYAYIDLSALLTQYEFDDTDTIYFTVTSSGHVSASVALASIGPEHLTTDYLGDITEQANIATTAKNRCIEAENTIAGYAVRAEGAEDAIREMTQMSQFSLDDNGNLVYTNETTYNFSVNEDGDLEWEVVA